MAQESQGSERLMRLIILLLCVVFIWVLYLVSMLYLSGRWDTLSNFGQSFGALDALFSGLAFAGLIYAILLQRRDLQLQKEELQRMASAQERSEEALRQQAKTMLLTSRLNMMTSIVDLRRARQEINRDLRDPHLGIMGVSGTYLEQLNTFLEEMEHELAAVRQELQQWGNTPHAS